MLQHCGRVGYVSHLWRLVERLQVIEADGLSTSVAADLGGGLVDTADVSWYRGPLKDLYAGQSLTTAQW
jgi:hypothetical protein